MGGARRAGAGAPPGRRGRTPEPRNEDCELPDLRPLPSESPRSAPAPRPGPAPNVFRGRGRGGRTRGDAKGGAAAARCWLRRPGWTRAGRVSGPLRAAPEEVPGPGGSGLSFLVLRGRDCPWGCGRAPYPDRPRCPRPGPMALVTVSRSPPASGQSTPVGPTVSLCSSPRSWLPAGPGGARPAHCQPPRELRVWGGDPKCLAGRDWERVWRLPGT